MKRTTNTTRGFSLILALSVALPLAACASNQAPQSVAESVAFATPPESSFPEGVAWHPGKQAFLVSSLRGGSVGLVDLSGKYRVFADDARLITTSGIVFDAPRQRILVANEDVGVSPRGNAQSLKRTAQVYELDGNSGEVRRVYDFSHLSQGATLSNDLTVDDQGNIYVTDSFQPQIYKVAQGSGEVSVLVRDARLKPESSDPATGLLPNLNGIVYHPQGFLLAGDYVQGKLWRIPLDNPAALTEVALPECLKGPDGLLLQDAQTLAAVETVKAPDGSGMQSFVSRLRSRDNWRSAELVSQRELPGTQGATTATLRNGQIWVVNSRFPQLFGNPQAHTVTGFELLRLAE